MTVCFLVKGQGFSVLAVSLEEYQLLQISNLRQHLGVCYEEITQLDQEDYHSFHYS